MREFTTEHRCRGPKVFVPGTGQFLNSTLETRKLRGDQIEVFKILNMKILIITFFQIKESKITRGHNFTLVNKQVD